MFRCQGGSSKVQNNKLTVIAIGIVTVHRSHIACTQRGSFDASAWDDSSGESSTFRARHVTNVANTRYAVSRMKLHRVRYMKKYPLSRCWTISNSNTVRKTAASEPRTMSSALFDIELEEPKKNGQ